MLDPEDRGAVADYTAALQATTDAILRHRAGGLADPAIRRLIYTTIHDGLVQQAGGQPSPQLLEAFEKIINEAFAEVDA